MKYKVLFASFFYLYSPFCISSEESDRALDSELLLQSSSHNLRKLPEMSSFKATGKDKALKTWIDNKVLYLAATSYGPNPGSAIPTNNVSNFPSFVTELSDDLLISYQLSKQKCSKLIHENQVNILLVGDSVSRYMVQDWCFARTGIAAATWGIDIIYERGRNEATGACRWNNITISFVHILGSEEVGPYAHGYINNEQDVHVDTELRVPYAIQQYTAEYGQPTVALFRTDLWDLSNFLDDTSRHLENRTLVMERIIHNQFWLIDLIHQNLPDAYIGSHTIPSIQWEGRLFPIFENAARYVSSARNTFVLEWDHLLNARSWEGHLRDGHHPNTEACLLFTDLLTTLLQAWSCVRPTASV